MRAFEKFRESGVQGFKSRSQMTIGLLERSAAFVKRIRCGRKEVPDFHPAAAEGSLPQRYGFAKLGKRRLDRRKHRVVDFLFHALATEFRLENILTQLIGQKRSEPGVRIDDVEKARAVRSKPRIHGNKGRAAQNRIVGIFKRRKR